ncbi:putative IQ motif and ankyrin repeat domain-containing protein [Lingula anatina]|uniref:IQ motif and ankyrin repeat domain-containing protein n=1 Tax=Lingula anatina TaxID=7574 RepID=A0A1S3HUW6_LINAN|nr:putative IQ motif and ankyrin repeat domain-containing protein [Lingula anatina]|eukprot:XP_013389832.1 putative IQ motif and ankyrin repeat domain-containing protein [Lingula anatina]
MTQFCTVATTTDYSAFSGSSCRPDFNRFILHTDPRMPPKPVAKKPAAKPAAKTAVSGAKPGAKPAGAKTTTKPTAKPAPKATETKPEAKKEPEKVAEAPPAGININIKELAGVLFAEENNKVRASGKWPLLVDPSGISGTFLKYRHVNYIDAFNPSEMEPDRIRMALLGALKFAKALVVDMNEVDMFDTVVTRFEEIQKGLMDKIMDQSILTIDTYKSLMKDGDPPEFEVDPHKTYLMEETMKQFMFILITKSPEPSLELKKKMFVVTIG